MKPADDDARLSDFTELADRASALAPTLVGLPVSEARSRVESNPGMSIRQVEPGQVVTLEFRAGRVTVTVTDDVVTEAGAG